MKTVTSQLPETKLTGNFYFRPSWFGLVILVEVERAYPDGDKTFEFRKANYTDLFQLNLFKSLP